MVGRPPGEPTRLLARGQWAYSCCSFARDSPRTVEVFGPFVPKRHASTPILEVEGVRGAAENGRDVNCKATERRRELPYLDHRRFSQGPVHVSALRPLSAALAPRACTVHLRPAPVLPPMHPRDEASMRTKEPIDHSANFISSPHRSPGQCLPVQSTFAGGADDPSCPTASSLCCQVDPVPPHSRSAQANIWHS